jgi:hypothetical protein
MKRPSPVPSKDLETNFENKLGNTSGTIPCPVSLMLTMLMSPLLLPLALETVSDIIDIDPSFVNFSAFDKRLEIT